MSKIIAVIFDHKVSEDVYELLPTLQEEGKLDLIDFSEIEVKDNGKIRFDQQERTFLSKDSEDNFLPAFIGLLFFHPQHQSSQRVDETLKELSLDAEFLRDLRSEVLPGSSILFLMVRNEQTESLLSTLAEISNRAVETDISFIHQDMLHKLFRGQSSTSQEANY